jgi:hypothetical protein
VDVGGTLVCVGVGVGVAVASGVELCVGVGVGVASGVELCVGVGVGVAPGVELCVGVGVGVGVGAGVELSSTTLVESSILPHPIFLLSSLLFIYTLASSELNNDPINPNTDFSGFPRGGILRLIF